MHDHHGNGPRLFSSQVIDQEDDPTYGGNARNNNNATRALPDAPLSGHWFPAQFQQLLQNAFPPL